MYISSSEADSWVGSIYILSSLKKNIFYIIKWGVVTLCRLRFIFYFTEMLRYTRTNTKKHLKQCLHTWLFVFLLWKNTHFLYFKGEYNCLLYDISWNKLPLQNKGFIEYLFLLTLLKASFYLVTFFKHWKITIITMSLY